MIRRLNFTGRKKLARKDVTIRLGASGTVEAQLALETYELPPSARLFVEAYRQTAWQRLDFGTVAEPVRSGQALSGFGSLEGIRFRVRVVEAQPSGPAPLILALVDGLTPVRPAGKAGGLSLLPVDWGELAAETWRLVVDDESGPLLLVSRPLVPDREAFVGSPEFVSLALPEILRRIVERALLSGATDEEEGGWAADWLRLARTLPGVTEPPARGDEPALSDEEEDWLADVVEAFGRARGIPERFERWWKRDA